MPSVVKCPGCTGEVAVPDELHGNAVLCPRCEQRFTAPDEAPLAPSTRPAVRSAPAPGARKFCHHCGTSIAKSARVCPGCGSTQPDMVSRATMAEPMPLAADHMPPRIAVAPENNRILCGILAIVLGVLGVHKFVMGYTAEGWTLVMITVFGSCIGLGPIVSIVIGIVEGIVYLSKSDAEFHRSYEVGHKGWF